MLFSIIIPAFNRLQFLSRTLASVWQQTYADYELIVVDDGSSDGTAEYLESVRNRVKIFCQSNKGPGAARNLGASQARGDYVAFLDSDDLWFSWTLACFAELIRRYEQPAILAAKLVEFSTESELVAVRETELKADAFPDYFASHRLGYFVGAGMSVFRRDEFLKTRGYTDQRINAEDHDLILRMGDARDFVQITSPVTLGWRRHAGSATRNLRRTLNGILYLAEQERRAAYPGGPSRARARREIITRHTRSLALECLRQGLGGEAWRLYRTTFVWNAALGRARYLAGFPLLMAMAKFRASQTPALRPSGARRLE